MFYCLVVSIEISFKTIDRYTSPTRDADIVSIKNTVETGHDPGIFLLLVILSQDILIHIKRQKMKPSLDICDGSLAFI